MSDPVWPRIASFKTPAELKAHLAKTQIPLPLDEVLEAPAASPLALPLERQGVRIGNRFCILPMEGWDGTREGEPSDLTKRRWRHFGKSGAKLIWGGEAVAVRPEGRANPNQLMISEATLPALDELRRGLIDEHREQFGANADSDLFLGLQLTHSGRYARPNLKDRPEPLVAYAHPVLDRRFPGGMHVLTDDDLDRLVADFVAAARLASKAGYQFVDVKHCHGYLGHELLSARTREGRFGGPFENRTRFLREVVHGIRAEVPGLRIGVRVSIFDTVPYRRREDQQGEAEARDDEYDSAFGLVRGESLEAGLADGRELLGLLREIEVPWVCITAGSPYYNPHIQRPALFPPNDGYLPPEDPLRGVARQIAATAKLKAEFPDLVIVGSAYSYLQEYVPHVGQRILKDGGADFIGLGRMALSYPELPADVLAGRPLRRKSICRTFSDCTTAPRSGLVSGCYPLDPVYTKHPDAARLREVKEGLRV